MAAIEVELPDGSVAEFPEDMPQDKISEAVKSHLSPRPAPVNPQLGSPGADVPPTTTVPASPELTKQLAAVGGDIPQPKPTTAADILNKPFEIGGKILRGAYNIPAQITHAYEPLGPEESLTPKIVSGAVKTAVENITRPKGMFGEPGPSTDLSKAAGAVAERTAQSLGQPEMLASIPFFESKIVRGLMLASQALQTPEQVKKVADVFKNPDATAQQKWEALGDAGVNLAMTAGLALSLKPAEVRARMTPEEAAKAAETEKPVPPEIQQANAAGLKLAAAEAAKGGEENAEGIRENQGQPQAAGKAAEGGKTDSGSDVQQTPSEQPQPVGARGGETQGKVALKPPANPPEIKGLKFLNETTFNNKKRWSYEADFGNGRKTTITVPEGTNETAIQAMVESRRQQYQNADIDEEIDRQIEARRKPNEESKGRDVITNPQPVKLEDILNNKTGKMDVGGKQVGLTEAAWNSIASEIKSDPSKAADVISRWGKELREAEKFKVTKDNLDQIHKTYHPQLIREGLISIATHGDAIGLDDATRRAAWKEAVPQESEIPKEVTPNAKEEEKKEGDVLASAAGGEKPSAAVPIGAGPGAATANGATATTDIGQLETNIPPLEKLADAVKRFPKQAGAGFQERLRQWMDDVGIPIKDYATRALVGAKAATAKIVDAFTKLAKVTTMDRAVGDWNLADTEGDIAARRFAKAVKARFPDRSKLRAFSNWINAGGDKELLQRQADLTTDPELKKTYMDALKFGPDEERLGSEIKQYHDEMLAEAMRAGALDEGLENYIHRYYPREDDPVRQRLESQLNTMRFTKNFSGFKKRFYDSDFEAEQAGLKPEKDAAKRILAYDQGFRKALTARAFVKDRYQATMPDGRPEIDVTGIGIPSKTDVETGKESPYLVKPKSKAGGDSPEDYRGDYVTFDHPAFRKWKWVGSDANGKPILMEGEMAVHPDAVKKYRALFERSWFQKNPVGRALLAPSHFVKQTMLALSAFHPVQIGIHAIEHKVNPFKLTDLNTRDPAQAELIKGGLTVSDLDGANHFSEGVGGSGLFGKIPIAGEMIKASQDWLFKDFIPRIKMTMALDALERNRKTYAKDLANGKITDEQLVRLTARESNAAFGEQNYRAMFRHKSFQDLLRFAFLAPDFGEARLRFPLQAMTKYGGEQRMALTLGAVGMFVAAKTAEKLLTGKMNLKKPFTVTYKDREYGLRNVASDLYHMFTDPAGYLRNRLNPIYTRPALEMLSGRDAFGRKRSGGQQAIDEAKQIVPISVRGAFEKDQSMWESFVNAIGLTEHRASAFGQAMKAVNAWKQKKGYTEPGEFVYDADKDPYSKLTTALTYGSPGDARKQLDALTEGKTPADARKIAAHYRRSLAEHQYLTGSRKHEQEYVKTLDASGKQAYDEAKAERKAMWQKFVKVWRSRYPVAQ